MPTVPLDSSFNVAPQALPGARVGSIASGDDFGGIAAKQASQVGQAAMSLGTDLSAIQTNIQERQNADSLFRAESQLKADALQFHADQQQRQGVNAWDMTKDTAKWWDDAGQKYSAGLDNEAQRAAFQKTFTSLRGQAVAASSLQESNQRRKSLEESAKASMVGSISLAALNYTTPGAVTQAVDDITKRTSVVANLNGWTPERRDMETGNNLTNLHKQVLQNMVQDNPDQAQAYFDHYKQQISGAERDGIARTIAGVKFTKSAESFGDAAVASNMSEGDAIAAARAQFSGDEEKQVVLEVKTRFQEKSKAREDMQKDAADQAFGIYARTGRLSAVPQDVRDKLDGRVLISLRHEAEAKAGGTAIKTDPDTYYTLRQMASQTPDKFAGTDLRGYFNQLDRGDREKLIELQTKVQKPDQLKDVQALSAQLSDAHDLQGWNAAKTKEKGAFDRAVTNALDTEQTAAGRPLTFADRQKVIDRYIVNGVVKDSGFFRDDRKQYYQVAGTSAAAKFVPTEVPDMERQKIEAALKRNGKPVTDDAVLRLFKKKMANIQ